MTVPRKRVLRPIVLVIVTVLIATLCGIAIQNALVAANREEARELLQAYGQKLELQLGNSLNDAGRFPGVMLALGLGDEGKQWFEAEANKLIASGTYECALYVVGDIVTDALPSKPFGANVGKNLRDFPYVYTLSKVVQALTVEGPVTLDENGTEVFLFVQPIMQNGVYAGEIVLGRNAADVLSQLDLAALVQMGYEYELWRVDPQTGDKMPVAISDESVSFTHAERTSFQLPTQWTLSIQPKRGWISAAESVRIGVAMFTLAALLLWVGISQGTLRRQRRMLRNVERYDMATGLYNAKGFADELEKRLTGGAHVATLFYYVLEGYNRVAQLVGAEGEKEFLKEAGKKLMDYAQSPGIAARVGEGNFMIAVEGELDEDAVSDFGKGLSLELLWKVRVDDKKMFLNGRYASLVCHAGDDVAAVMARLPKVYAERYDRESAIRALTAQCRRLLAGESDVAFTEHADVELMELSKVFNQYRKMVEQLAYFDPTFHIGNRSKYVRDVGMYISYNNQRPFQVYCVDICDFSKYNELFSVQTGDLILQEFVERMGHVFGEDLYRINGDVLLGVSFRRDVEMHAVSEIEQELSRPVIVGSASFRLHVRIAACNYPDHGTTPEALLDCIQSALRYGKETDKDVVQYSPALDEPVKTEAHILQMLNDALDNETLEVWYQPICRNADGRFTAVEALVRLPDGKGGYFSAQRVVSIAENNGLVRRMGEYVLRVACAYMREFGCTLGVRRVSVNISVQQLLVGNSAEALLSQMEKGGLDPKYVTLEITESMLIQSIDHADSVLSELRGRGVQIALDDFGMGFSSLNYLSGLSVDCLKIDRALTTSVVTDKKQLALLHAVVEMGKVNRLNIVAEGVETEEQLHIIRMAGVSFAQGYYYAKPMKAADVTAFLRERNGINEKA